MKFFRAITNGLICCSVRLLSISKRPSSKYRVSPFMFGFCFLLVRRKFYVSLWDRINTFASKGHENYSQVGYLFLEKQRAYLPCKKTFNSKVND